MILRSLVRFLRTRGGIAVQALAFVIALAGQFGSHAHLALIPHAVCSEHGDLTDSETDHGHSGGQTAESGQWIGVSPDGDSHAAHHCMVVLSRRIEVILDTSPRFEHSLSPGDHAIPDAPVACHSSIAILRLAPKHSPPTA